VTQAEIPLQAAPFAEAFIDVAEINAHVSEHVLARVSAVRAAASEGRDLSTHACAVLGPAGAGKTHLFTRLRHHAGPRATLLLLRPYFGVSLSPRDVLALVVDQMCRPARNAELSQLELVVSAWLGPAPSGAAFPAAAIEDARSLPEDERRARIEEATLRTVRVRPELGAVTHLVRAVLTLPSRAPSDAWGELAWLSGREPRAGGGERLSEPDVMHVISLLATIAAPTAPLVLVFDQLENLASESDERVLAYGTLLAELVDTVPLLTVVQLALTSEWMQYIAPRLSLPQKTRVAAETFLLESPTRGERELLLRAWHERLSPRGPRGGAARFPRPLSAEQLEELLEAPGMTPRLLLAAFKRGLAGKPLSDDAPVSAVANAPAGPGDHAREVFAREVAEVEAELAERRAEGVALDPPVLAEALASALSFVPHLEVETRSERERLLTTVRGPGHSLSVLYLAATHHASAAALLARATDLASTGKVVVLRERRLELPPTWATVAERRAAFESSPNARWLWLEADDTTKIVALARLLSQARAGRVRPAGASAPLDVGAVRNALEGVLAPASWPPAALLERWLGDVPRAAPHAAGAKTSGRDVARESADQERGRQPPREDLGKMVRELVGLGREVGRAALGRTLRRLRSLREG
jgi:hypothetical protein